MSRERIAAIACSSLPSRSTFQRQWRTNVRPLLGQGSAAASNSPVARKCLISRKIHGAHIAARPSITPRTPVSHPSLHVRARWRCRRCRSPEPAPPRRPARSRPNPPRRRSPAPWSGHARRSPRCPQSSSSRAVVTALIVFSSQPMRIFAVTGNGATACDHAARDFFEQRTIAQQRRAAVLATRPCSPGSRNSGR